MSTSLQDLRDISYDILKENEDVSAYPLTLIDQLLNSAQLRICNWLVVNKFTWDAVRKWTLPFLNTDQFYTNISWTTLSSDTTIWWATITVNSTTDFPSSGSLFINWDIISYTWTTATSFTWVTWLWFTHLSWASVYAVFNIPSDFMSAIQVIYNYQFKLNGKVYDDIFEDLNDYKWTTTYTRDRIYNIKYTQPFYTIINETYLVPFNLNNTGDMIHLRYTKLPTELDSSNPTTSYATITNDIFAKSTIPYLAVWETLFNRWEETRASQLLNFAYWQVEEMYNYYNNRTVEKKSRVNYKMWKWKYLNL